MILLCALPRLRVPTHSTLLSSIFRTLQHGHLPNFDHISSLEGREDWERWNTELRDLLTAHCLTGFIKYSDDTVDPRVPSGLHTIFQYAKMDAGQEGDHERARYERLWSELNAVVFRILRGTISTNVTHRLRRSNVDRCNAYDLYTWILSTYGRIPRPSGPTHASASLSLNPDLNAVTPVPTNSHSAGGDHSSSVKKNVASIAPFGVSENQHLHPILPLSTVSRPSPSLVENSKPHIVTTPRQVPGQHMVSSPSRFVGEERMIMISLGSYNIVSGSDWDNGVGSEGKDRCRMIEVARASISTETDRGVLTAFSDVGDRSSGNVAFEAIAMTASGALDLDPGITSAVTYSTEQVTNTIVLHDEAPNGDMVVQHFNIAQGAADVPLVIDNSIEALVAAALLPHDMAETMGVVEPNVWLLVPLYLRKYLGSTIWPRHFLHRLRTLQHLRTRQTLDSGTQHKGFIQQGFRITCRRHPGHAFEQRLCTASTGRFERWYLATLSTSRLDSGGAPGIPFLGGALRGVVSSAVRSPLSSGNTLRLPYMEGLLQRYITAATSLNRTMDGCTCVASGDDVVHALSLPTFGTAFTASSQPFVYVLSCDFTSDPILVLHKQAMITEDPKFAHSIRDSPCVPSGDLNQLFSSSCFLFNSFLFSQSPSRVRILSVYITILATA
ncbi:hypothetical protein NMY22_g16659 [Coprinellus aureogranulatus]|nr:hypothetical protein NMY22_g16659 [Coprinellus aureogranulatus]